MVNDLMNFEGILLGGEVFKQRERVRKGWFPMRKSCPKAKNPKRKNEY